MQSAIDITNSRKMEKDWKEIVAEMKTSLDSGLTQLEKIVESHEEGESALDYIELIIQNLADQLGIVLTGVTNSCKKLKREHSLTATVSEEIEKKEEAAPDDHHPSLEKTFPHPVPVVLQDTYAFDPRFLPLEEEEHEMWKVVKVFLEKMDLVLDVMFASFHSSVHVHHNDDPFNPVSGQIDLMGPVDKVVAVKKIVDNIPWTINHPLPKGFIEANFRRTIENLSKGYDDVEILFFDDKEIVIKGKKGPCEEAQFEIIRAVFNIVNRLNMMPISPKMDDRFRLPGFVGLGPP